MKKALILLCWALLYFPVQVLGVVLVIDGKCNGLVFEGIGVVSAGASSRLLIDYPEPYRSDILDFLFKPFFGASLQHFKFEVGGDVNSTCGVEPSHARTREEMVNPLKRYFERGYELWMASEAKKRNPRIYLDILQWGAPGWFDKGFYSKDNSDYLVSYIQGIKKYLGLDINYCGLWNEKHIPDQSRNYVVNFLRPALNDANLNKVKIVGNDMYCNSPTNHIAWSYADELMADSGLFKAIDILGYHYLTVEATPVSKMLGIPIWESEGSILNGDWENALRFARNTNLNYINSRAVKTIIWNPVDAYYPNVSWNNIGAMEAKTPWCGHYVVKPAIWAIAHTTQFAKPGWVYLDDGCGKTSENTMLVTLKNPDTNDFSMIIVSGEKEETLDITLKNLESKTLNVWRSNSDIQFSKQPSIYPNKNSFNLKLEPNSIYTITTTSNQKKGVASNKIPESKPFPKIYIEDFESYAEYKTPRYLSDQGGCFDVISIANGKKVLQQEITHPLICWDSWGPNNPEPYTQFGTLEYEEYDISVDTKIGVKGCAKIFGHVKWFESNTAPHGIELRINADGKWSLFVNQKERISGITALNPTKWNNLKLSFTSKSISAFCNDKPLCVISAVQDYSHGLAGLGSDWNNVQFDNLCLQVRR